MSQPVKPFACSIAECGMTFTNEDHLHVHTKKHDMVLTLGMEQKAVFVADQTPTPTRFIRNCEEVGLFQDLQNVNPFDEGFKRAMETKGGVLSLDGSLLTPAATDDVLHTPQMYYPITDADTSMYNQRNITISRSSSDESGAIKEYETTTISKLTNEVTTISRVIEKTDQIYHNHDIANKETNMKFTNNTVTIQSLVKKDLDSNKVVSSSLVASKVDQGLMNASNYTEIPCKDVLLLNRSDVPPILSQKSLDYVVDSLTNENYMQETNISGDKDRNVNFINESIESNNKTYNTEMELRNRTTTKKQKLTPPVKKTQNRKRNKNVNIKSTKDKKIDCSMDGLEVILKLPNQKFLKMRPVEELTNTDGCSNLLTEYAKDKLKNNLEKKLGPVKQSTESVAQNVLQTKLILPISSGTLIPVKIINPLTTTIFPPNTFNDCKVQIEHNIKTEEINNEQHLVQNKHDNTKSVKRKNDSIVILENTVIKRATYNDDVRLNDKQSDNRNNDNDGVQVKSDIFVDSERIDLLARKSAASQRYRRKFKSKIESQKHENEKLKQENMKLQEENARLKTVIIEHAKKCPNPSSLSVYRINVI